MPGKLATLNQIAQDKKHFLRALRFYQRRGFHLVAIIPGAMTRERLIRPEIPLIGHFGIEIRDEIELEMLPGGEPGGGE